jgi:hypothetical protein
MREQDQARSGWFLRAWPPNLQRLQQASERMLCQGPWILFLVCLSFAHAQTTPGTLTFALPKHLGRMTLDQGAWQVVELSAKPNGSEWGERAAQGKQHMLAFLFVVPEGSA